MADWSVKIRGFALQVFVTFVYFLTETLGKPAASRNCDPLNVIKNGSDYYNKTCELFFGGGLGGGIVFVVIVTALCCCYYHCKKSLQKNNAQSLCRPLLDNEFPAHSNYVTLGGDQERNPSCSEIDLQLKFFFEISGRKYSETLKFRYPDLGSRVDKYWFKVTRTTDNQEVLLNITPVSKKCPIKLNNSRVETLNDILAAIKHPYVQPIHEIAYLGEHYKVIVVQSLHESKGSLKDIIHKSTPINDWAMKYRENKPLLKKAKICRYGRQILEAMMYLYEMGFPPLGHVQTGNIFVENDACQLGGYENTLLGYKTRLYKTFKEHLEHIDVVMFGHVIFEMSSAIELDVLTPTKEQFANKPELQEVLEYIFAMDLDCRKFVHSIPEILQHPFFQEIDCERPLEIVVLSSDMKEVMDQVKKGKPREQNDPANLNVKANKEKHRESYSQRRRAAEAKKR